MRANEPFPEIVSREEWQARLDAVRAKEKAHTRQGDAIAADRRRLPMTRVDATYAFEGAEGTRSLLDLFEGRPQLIVYHFMFGPSRDEGCDGCSWVVDGMTHPGHLHARGTSLVLISRAPFEKLASYRSRMGWALPWYSSFGSPFNEDMGATVDGQEEHGLSVFVRRGTEVFRSYYTGARGVEHLGSHWTYLDLTPYGRQEDWEESPPGWPQEPPYGDWPKRHDEYE